MTVNPVDSISSHHPLLEQIVEEPLAAIGSPLPFVVDRLLVRRTEPLAKITDDYLKQSDKMTKARVALARTRCVVNVIYLRFDCEELENLKTVS